MRGVEDFIYLLAIAFIILICLGIYSAYYPSPQPPVNFTAVISLSPGKIGWLEEIPAKTWEIGEVVPGEQTQTLLQVGQVEVKRSYWAERKESFQVEVPDWGLEWIRKVRISFQVWDANLYGNLRVLWNGKELLNQPSPIRSYTFEIDPEDVFSKNVLDFEADLPGLRFWAYNVYIIRDLKVELVYGPAKFFPFDLLPSELEAFQKGKLSFYGFGDGNVSIKVNGYEIYNRHPTGPDSVEFTASQAGLTAGENTLSFRSLEGEVKLENVRLEVWILTQNLQKTFSFNLSQQDYERIKKIRIWLDILRPGGLKLELNGNVLEPAQVTAGLNEFDLQPDLLHPGLNQLKLSTTGTLDIQKLELGY